MTKATFDNRNNDFFLSLKKDVDQYFEKNHLAKTGNWRLFSKTVILLTTAVVLYIFLIKFNYSWWMGTLACMAFGFNLACIGFCIMHDANHGSYSSSPIINKIFGFTINLLGASGFFWRQKHNILHHTYTNIDGLDDDIAKSPIIRQCESQKWVPMHKIQHLYLIPIYSLSTLFWIFNMDFVKYFTGKIYTTDAWKMDTREKAIFWITKTWYLTIYIILPIIYCGFLPWLAGFFITNATLGLVLSFVFQLAHVVETTEFEHVDLDETKHLETAWAQHQIKTTSNFSMNSKLVSWFLGGLNFQVEHHLFPKVSHIHYPAISKIVMQKCKEFNIQYNKYDTMVEAIGSHLRFMKLLGKAQVVVRNKPAFNLQ